MKLRIACVIFGFLSLVLSLVQLTFAQAPIETASALPRLVRFSGTVKDLNSTPLTGVVGITFALYSEQTGGAALWLETQNVTADNNGHYTALLGSTKPDGLPAELFTSEQVRWVGVQISGQAEQPRVLLVSVPYALKAVDADTVGGMPPSAFLLANSMAASAANPGQPSAAIANSNALAPAATTITGSGTTDFVPLWTGTSTLGNSVLFQSTAKSIGIGNTTPAATLDVTGSGIFRGFLELPATGTATSTTDFNSQPFDFLASSFSSSTKAAVNQHFRWQAEPVGNDTTTPLGKLNLLFASGTGTPAETGLSISNKGIITFAAGQTLPAVTGNESVTGTLSVGDQLISKVATGTAPLKVTSTTQVANLNASLLDGLSASAFAQLGAGTNSFSGVISSPFIETSNETVVVEEGSGFYNSVRISGGSGPGISVANIGSSGPAIMGNATGNSGETFGVSGSSLSNAGVGVLGTGVSSSTEGTSFGGLEPIGVWGDTGVSYSSTSELAYGVLGTADDNNAVVGYNDSPSGITTALFENFESAAPNNLVLWTLGPGMSPPGICTIDVSGNLGCNGTKSAVVPVDSGNRQVALYAVEAPQNWFEDFGSGQLVAGSATVPLEATFAQTVNTGAAYHVFLTPEGDCEGLYVANKTAEGFEVRELRSGRSNVAFDYRIVALRKGYEGVRLADKTEQWKQMMAHAPKRRATPGPKLPLAAKPPNLAAIGVKRASLASQK